MRKATKDPSNVFYSARTDAAKQNDRLSSRYSAGIELGIDYARMNAIETGTKDPYPDEVVMMAELYHAPELMPIYCSQHCMVGRCNHAPEVELQDLDRCVIAVVHGLRHPDEVIDELLDVAADGAITTNEQAQVDDVIAYLDKIVSAAAQLRLYVAKNVRR
jgi:hypothetical protein